MAIDTARPVYEWDVAEVGDSLPPDDSTVEARRIQTYVEAFARAHGFNGVAVPISMVCRVASTRRRQIMNAKGYEHPVRPTPFAHWECETFAPMQVGDVITSETKMAEKYEKRGRHYVVWHVVGRNQRGEKVLEYRYTNLWDLGKPEDRQR